MKFNKDIAASAANVESAAIKRKKAEEKVHDVAVDVVNHLRKSKGI